MLWVYLFYATLNLRYSMRRKQLNLNLASIRNENLSTFETVLMNSVVVESLHVSQLMPDRNLEIGMKWKIAAES